MDHYAGLDVSLKATAVCIVDAAGQITRETKVTSEPGTVAQLLRDAGVEITRIGLETGPLSQWLFAGLTAAGFNAVLLET